MSKKITLGDDLLTLEEIIDRMIDRDGLQRADILNLVNSQIVVHRQDCIEVYLDGTSPIFYYGPEDGR